MLCSDCVRVCNMLYIHSDARQYSYELRPCLLQQPLFVSVLWIANIFMIPNIFHQLFFCSVSISTMYLYYIHIYVYVHLCYWVTHIYKMKYKYINIVGWCNIYTRIMESLTQKISRIRVWLSYSLTNNSGNKPSNWHASSRSRVQQWMQL